MNASYEWLRTFVPFKLTPTELRDLLTSRCATVDDVVSLREDLRDIVIGRVVEAARHPNSDHLWLTKVDAGGGALVEVVCGAANVSVNTLYPFAPVGAVLPGGMKIEKRKIRGETSEGMLCSAKELGLGQDQEGIMALSVVAEPGTKFLDAMPISDTRLVIDVLPNRPDLLSHEGLAREIAAATGGTVTRPEIAEEKPFVIRTHTVKATSGKVGDVTVKLEDSDGCHRYAGAVITGLKVGPSPTWLARRIEAAGARSINNVVDVTNYMLLDYAVRLILSTAGGIPQGSPIDLYPLPKRPAPISLRLARIARLLGEPVESGEVEKNLRSVGFRIAPEAKDVLKISPPSWRHDVKGDADLAEEIARLRGYDTFSSEMRPFRACAVPDASLVAVTRHVQEALVGAGLNEVRPMPFVAENKGGTVRVTNPLAEDEAFLRGDLITTLVSRAEYNLARMQGNVRLFEIGTAFFAGDDPAALPGPKKAALPREEMHVAALVMGQRSPTHFTKAVQPSYDEWDIKFLAERTASAAFPEMEIELVPGSLDILWDISANRVKVGTARRLTLDAPVWAKPAFGLEINLEALEQTVLRRKTYQAIPATPRAQVDLALIVATSVTAAQIERVIRREAGDLLETLTLFDEFVGQGIPEGSRSLAWALTFRDRERTLKDKEVQGRTEKIVKALEGELGVRQRTT